MAGESYAQLMQKDLTYLLIRWCQTMISGKNDDGSTSTMSFPMVTPSRDTYANLIKLSLDDIILMWCQATISGV